MKLNNIFRKIKIYWAVPFGEQSKKIKSGYLTNQPLSRKLVVSALLSALAAAFQLMGALGGVGLAVSALVTLPISLAGLLSIYSGLMSYFATLILLVVLQPSELVIFPFTTGLLGLSIGFAYKYLNSRIAIVSFSALFLTFGIALLLYVFTFPILGSIVSTSFSYVALIIIYFTSVLYSWLWFEISTKIFKVLNPALTM